MSGTLKYAERQILMTRPGTNISTFVNDRKYILIRTDALFRSSGNCTTTVAFGMPEPYEWKLSCTVLRGERRREPPDLPGGRNTLSQVKFAEEPAFRGGKQKEINE